MLGGWKLPRPLIILLYYYIVFPWTGIDGLIYAIDTKILYKYYFFELRKRILLLRVVCV